MKGSRLKVQGYWLMAEGWLKVQGIWLLLDLAWLVMKAEG